jgi:hypothetical protein
MHLLGRIVEEATEEISHLLLAKNVKQRQCECETYLIDITRRASEMYYIF